jgi:hypothetical protein
MKLTLYRTQYLPECVKGNLYIDGNLECFTLEPPLKFDGQENVEDKTCIPEGSYSVIRVESHKFNYGVPGLVGVPGRQNIEMHIGNYPTDTEGCILLGKTWTDGALVGSSAEAFDALMEEFNKALYAHETVTLDVMAVFEAAHA